MFVTRLFVFNKVKFVSPIWICTASVARTDPDSEPELNWKPENHWNDSYKKKTFLYLNNSIFGILCVFLAWIDGTQLINNPNGSLGRTLELLLDYYTNPVRFACLHRSWKQVWYYILNVSGQWFEVCALQRPATK